MFNSILKHLKKPLIKIHHLFLDLSWRIRVAHHNTASIDHLFFPFKKYKITYDLKSKKIKDSSLIEIYKIKNLYRPAHHYFFFSPRFETFIADRWVGRVSQVIKRNRQNINIDLQNVKKINRKKPVFFITSTNVYSYFIYWNIYNILLLIKNKISFDVVVHEDLNKTKNFNRSFVNFLKKYLNLKIIYLDPDKNLLIKSETILLSNYRKFGVVDISNRKSDYEIFPKEIYTDLSKYITKNVKLKKYFGKPRNDIVLISRKDSRIIANEEELLYKIPIIKKIVPEELNFEEQLSFYYHAKIVISTHGAAMANIFFARPKKTTVIRLTYDKIDDNDQKMDIFSNYNIFEMMAENLDINYIIQKHGSFYGKSTEKNSHFFVNIKKLDFLIKKISKK